MANVLDDATLWLADQLQYHAGTVVQYQRGDLLTAAITATRSPRRHQVADTEGLLTEYVAGAWLFRRSDLVIKGQVITPRPNDLIVIDGTVAEIVLPPDESRPCWADEDPAGTLILVYAKQTES